MTTTAKLGITLLEPTDHVVGTSVLDGWMFKLNDGINRVDNQIGTVICTSITRPSSPFPQQTIFETDTRLMYVRNLANNAWVMVNTGIPVVATTGSITSPFTDQIIYDQSAACLKRYTGSLWVIYNPGTISKFKTTDTNRSSTTSLTADTHLVLTGLLPSSAYKVDGYIAAKGPSAADLNCDLVGPTGCSILWTNFANVGPDAGDTGLTNYNVVPQGDSVARGINLIDTTNPVSFPMKGIVITDTNGGSLTWRWAQKVSNGTACTVMAGSYLEAKRIG